MEFFDDLFRYGYLTNAFAACVLAGITCGIIGTYVVCRRMVFLSGGITHASFGGLGIAFYFGADPILGAMTFAVLSALGIEWAGSRGRIREDSAIGIIWSVGMAVAFDRSFAASRGIPTRLISYVMSALVAVTIVLSIRIMGIVLLISLITMPVVIVNTLSRSFRTIAWCAPAVAVAGNVAGLAASYRFEVPPGAAIIFTLTLALILAKALSLCRKKSGTEA